MAVLTTRSSNSAIREVSRGLAAARDQQILQVVAMVDAMPLRGAADQLLAPLRPRLARLRPPRPLRFARLLFMPLDPLIVPPARWRLEHHTIPRTVVPLLAASVELGLGGPGQRIAAMIEGRTTADIAIVAEAGSVLWKQAANLLMTAPRPEGWENSGLSAQMHVPLARRIATLLSQADPLRQMVDNAAQGLVPPDIEPVRRMLETVTRHDPDALPMMVALLLARIPDAAPMLPRLATLLGGRAGPMMRRAGEQASDLLLEQLEAPGGAEGQLGGRDLAEAGATVRRLTSLLRALEGDSMSPERRTRLNDVRQRIREGCQSLFAERLSTDLLEPLQASDGDQAAVWELEAAARGLRALETEARRAGGDKSYDTLLSQTAALVREKIDHGELDHVGGLRLMEIVAGPDVALALLGDEVG